ncbi:type II toxin-antitoxin system HicB family antitoxin [Zobellella denitrificans]|uniref:type II toxin-antitoxin system HicB family antitoxin n=1 Tax=Zobellella denitrificans TaxID=347534 RepID=UPI001E5AB8FB|nr:type II toxin-antitoxin system HicB family antitoxin [Zobellella denitrificans]
MEDYNHCDDWLLLDVDLTESMGKPKRINVSLPGGIIQLIDTRVKSPVLASFSDFSSQAYALLHCSLSV